jgi:excisionase family DNA binding protein
MDNSPAPAVEPLAHSPPRAAQRLGISTRAVYSHIATGELRSFKDGKRRLIPDTELQRFVARRMAAAAAA